MTQKHMKQFIICISVLFAAGCASTSNQNKNITTVTNPTTGTIEKVDDSFDMLFDKDATIEIIAQGLDWSEGPLWVESQKMLLFSDVPRDTIFKWTAKKGKEVYLTPSGYTENTPRGGEKGSNGLLLDAKGNLVICQCGNRQMARMDAPLNNPKPNYITLAGMYNGKRFNSPNDATYNNKGELFFTDPPYGLERQMNDPKKELKFEGVFQVKTDGTVVLVTDTLTRPNGIGFFPGHKSFLVSNSDPRKPNWYQYDINEDGSFSNGKIFYSVAGYERNLRGLPDGFKIDKKGNLFAAAPGGIIVVNRQGKLLGKIKLTEAASNIAFSNDEKTMYVTNDMQILRIVMRK